MHDVSSKAHRTDCERSRGFWNTVPISSQTRTTAPQRGHVEKQSAPCPEQHSQRGVFKCQMGRSICMCQVCPNFRPADGGLRASAASPRATPRPGHRASAQDTRRASAPSRSRAHRRDPRGHVQRTRASRVRSTRSERSGEPCTASRPARIIAVVMAGCAVSRRNIDRDVFVRTNAHDIEHRARAPPEDADTRA